MLLAWPLVSGITIDRGRLPLPRELGRCCHDRVPERARLEALRDGEDVDADTDASDIALSYCAEGVRDFDANPLNSGMSFVGDSGAGSIAVDEDAGVVIDGGELKVLTLICDLEALIGAELAFSGLIDRARSAKYEMSFTPHHNQTNKAYQLSAQLFLACLSRSPLPTSYISPRLPSHAFQTIRERISGIRRGRGHHRRGGRMLLRRMKRDQWTKPFRAGIMAGLTSQKTKTWNGQNKTRSFIRN